MHYKRLLQIAVMFTLILSIAVAYAAEEVVTGEITNVVTAVDSNGNDYTQIGRASCRERV